MASKKKIEIKVTIGDSDNNGKLDVSGSVSGPLGSYTLKPRNLPRSEILSRVVALLGSLRLGSEGLAALKLPAVSISALRNMLLADRDEKPAAPAKPAAKAPAHP